MSNDSGADAIVGIAIVGGLLWALHSGIFFQTGRQYFDQCWAQQNSKDGSPSSAEQAVQWAKCEPTAQKAVYGAGIMFSGADGLTKAAQAIHEACPSQWDGGSLSTMAVQLIQSDGGPTFLDGYLPAGQMIAKTFRHKWPNCNPTREQYGYPKVVQVNGSWQLGKPCTPCDAEKKAETAAEKKGEAEMMAQWQALASARPAEGAQSIASSTSPNPPEASSSSAVAAQGPSFDCARAFYPDEKAICASPTLSALDRRLSMVYFQARAVATDPKMFREEQNQAIIDRRKCGGDEQCIANWYQERMVQLKKDIGPTPGS